MDTFTFEDSGLLERDSASYGMRHFRNVGKHSPNDTAVRPRKNPLLHRYENTSRNFFYLQYIANKYTIYLTHICFLQHSYMFRLP
jgi:hypothetical protein